MLILGVLLLAATGAFTALLVAGNLDGGADYTVTILGSDLATMSSLAIFLAGIALTLLFGLGCLLALAGARRTRRRSTELRSARASAGVRAPARARTYDRTVDPVAGAVGPAARPPADLTPDREPGRAPDASQVAGPDADAAAQQPAHQPTPDPVRRRHGIVHRLGR
ncbi:hypothetical protein [Kitasatospora sp. NPDC088346]|uniref:hypothetical protein n=1 Tax=Kitasatospora sp. NPDC088346 TaxID=3364073 RepID=UPI00380F3A51